jgi:hypothetical protein
MAYSNVYQASYEFGSVLGQLFSQVLAGNPQEDARIQAEAQQRAVAQQQMAQQVAAAQARAAELARIAEARKQQEIYDHLVATLKPSSDANNVNLGLKDLKNDESDTGTVGIKGLPGIYLNNKNGSGNNTPFGISGLPGIYVNGSSPGSGTGQPGEGNLRLMNDEGETSPNNNGGNVGNMPPNGTGMESAPQPQAANAPPALGALQQQAGASQAAAGAETPEEASVQAQAGFNSGPPAAPVAPVTLGGSGSPSPNTAVPQSQAANAPVLGSLQQQAGASQAAVGASTPEAASVQARGGFDSALLSVPMSGKKSGGLDFMTSDTSVVDLRSSEAGQILVDTGKIDRIVKESGLKINDVPPPAAVDPYFGTKTKTDIILDALGKGRIYGKDKPSDLDVSIKYINDYLLTRDPENEYAQEALSYLEGMRENATRSPGLINLHLWFMKTFPGEPVEDYVPGLTPQELLYLPKDYTLGLTPMAKGLLYLPEDYPGLTPQAKELLPEDYVPGLPPLAKGLLYLPEDYVPPLTPHELRGKSPLAPEDVLEEWRQETDSALHYALKEGKGDVNQAIGFLEKKINEDAAFRMDSPARSALNYLYGYQGYKDYEENNKK